MRIIHYRDSFLPVITGTIQPRPQGGTRVQIELRLAWPVALFMVAWIGGIAAITVKVWLTGYADAKGSSTMGASLMFPVLLMAAGYGLCSICFNLEARRARKLLLKILDIRSEI